MSDRSGFEEVKNIGDAGDSIPVCLDIQTADNVVCEMVRCIKLALHRGDHQNLKLTLEKLDFWRNQKDDEHIHNYWRVAQLTGEAELKNVCILLSVTSKKPENVKWQYLKDALSVLAMCLCNREIISTMLFYANDVQPILTMAVVQTCDEEVYMKSLITINKMLIVCREKFGKFIITPLFLDALIKGVQHWIGTSLQLTKMILQVVKSMFMCGDDKIFENATYVIKRLIDLFSDVNDSVDENQPTTVLESISIIKELAKGMYSDFNTYSCASYWTNGISTKELLREAQGQPWLFIHCSWPLCGVHNGMSQTFFRKCGACCVVRYCSRQCQTKHWNAGHHVQCKAIINRKKSV